MHKRFALLIGVAMLLASCWLTLGISENAYIETTIRFQLADGSPVEGARISIWESIGELINPTQILRTNKHGEIILIGYYCTPIEIWTHRANTIGKQWIIIRRDNVDPSYIVTLDRDEASAVGGGDEQSAEDSSAGGDAATRDVDRRQPRYCY